MFVFKLLAWHKQCGGGRPLREFVALAMSDRIAEKWAYDLLPRTREHPAATDAEIQDAFLKRFAAEVRRPATVARDKLHAGRVDQKSNQDVVNYVSQYLDVVRDVPDMTEGEKIRWFQAGLMPTLRTSCACDYRGCEFDTLEDCIQHAYGEERKMKTAALAGGRALKPAAYSTSSQQDEVGPTTKKAGQGV